MRGARHRPFSLFAANPGDVDEAEVAHIQPMLDVFTNTVEVLEASGGVFRFQYHGLIRNQHGMEAWARSLILESHPRPESVTRVEFATNRKRDVYFHEKV